MKRAELSGQHALAESPVAPSQHRAAIGAELRGDAEPRRHDVPRVERSQTGNHRVGLLPLRIERGQILTDGAAVIEAHADIQCEPVPDRDRIARERRRCEGEAAVGERLARDGLKRPSVAVDEPDAGRDDGGVAMLAPFDGPAHLPFVVGVREPRAGNA